MCFERARSCQREEGRVIKKGRLHEFEVVSTVSPTARYHRPGLDIRHHARHHRADRGAISRQEQSLRTKGSKKRLDASTSSAVAGPRAATRFAVAGDCFRSLSSASLLPPSQRRTTHPQLPRPLSCKSLECPPSLPRILPIGSLVPRRKIRDYLACLLLPARQPPPPRNLRPQVPLLPLLLAALEGPLPSPAGWNASGR
jgi:hypothetical protein